MVKETKWKENWKGKEIEGKEMDGMEKETTWKGMKW